MLVLNLTFALLYSTIFVLGTLSFVLATVFLRRWEGSAFLCFGDCTVPISIHESVRKVLHYYMTFGLFPIIFVTIWLAFVRLFHIMGRYVLPHSESRVEPDMCCYDDWLIEIIADVLSTIYNIIYAAVITVAYQAAYYQRRLYGVVIKYAEHLMTLDQKQLTNGHTNDRIMAILIGIIVMQYLSSLLWCMTTGLNVYLRRKHRMALPEP